MKNLYNDHINDLLREAEERLARGEEKKTPNATLTNEVGVEIVKTHEEADALPKQKELSVRVTQPRFGDQESKKKDTAGPLWFNMPKAEMTTQLKRDWQLLRMRGLLDPKHQKKALSKTPPEYLQVGELIAGPADPYGSRLSRAERRQTITQEVLSSHNAEKVRTKYAGIQKGKTSGKKAFYKKMVQKRKRQ